VECVGGDIGNKYSIIAVCLPAGIFENERKTGEMYLLKLEHETLN